MKKKFYGSIIKQNTLKIKNKNSHKKLYFCVNNWIKIFTMLFNYNYIISYNNFNIYIYVYCIKSKQVYASFIYFTIFFL